MKDGGSKVKVTAGGGSKSLLLPLTECHATSTRMFLQISMVWFGLQMKAGSQKMFLRWVSLLIMLNVSTSATWCCDGVSTPATAAAFYTGRMLFLLLVLIICPPLWDHLCTFQLLCCCAHLNTQPDNDTWCLRAFTLLKPICHFTCKTICLFLFICLF